MKKLFILAIVVLGFTALSFGQSAAISGDATATITNPVTLSQLAAMDFGIINTDGTAGSVSLASSAAGTLTESIPSIVAQAAGTAGLFRVTMPLNASTFNLSSLTLPTGDVLLRAAAGAGVDMVLNTFTTDFVTGTPENSIVFGTLGGSVVFYVGATLNLGSGQSAGSYSGTYPVTVNCN